VIWCWALDGMTRPHHAGATPAALASKGELQAGHLGLPFIVRHGSGLPGRWLSAVV